MRLVLVIGTALLRRRFGTSPDRAAAYELFCEAEWTLKTVKVPLGASNE